MGCFGYICKGCGEAVRTGELCTMIHLRHSKELGRVTGHYDSYGGVREQEDLPENKIFRGENAGRNSHDEMCKSEFNFIDSWTNLKDGNIERFYGRGYCTFDEYLRLVALKELRESHYNVLNTRFYATCKAANLNLDLLLSSLKTYEDLKAKKVDSARELLKSLLKQNIYGLVLDGHLLLRKTNSIYYQEFMKLRARNINTVSGIVVYHKVCYDKAEREGKLLLEPSNQDPNQSWGASRKRFM